VLAAVVRLLEATSIRVGNDEYARDNDSFGLTTLRNRHVRMHGATVRFRFKGKSGLWHSIEMNDRTIARIVRECQELPGYRLFQYVDEDGALCNVDSEDVNNYLREITGQDFSAKDFRTWNGTVLAARELNAAGPCSQERERKHNIADAIKRVARRLGNRPATCRKYYIHPAIIDAYCDSSLFEVMRQGIEQHEAYNGRGLTAEEYSVMVSITKFLEKATAVKRKPVLVRAA
jgi:DNA topoisomerase-1